MSPTIRVSNEIYEYVQTYKGNNMKDKLANIIMDNKNICHNVLRLVKLGNVTNGKLEEIDLTLMKIKPFLE